MKLNKKVAIIAMVAAVSLFASSQNINTLVDQINKTTDESAKGELMRKLDKELATMNGAEKEKAYTIINSKLKDPLKTN